LGLKVRTVVSLHVWDLIRGPAPGVVVQARESRIRRRVTSPAERVPQAC
jgi:hypothetical protein